MLTFWLLALLPLYFCIFNFILEEIGKQKAFMMASSYTAISLCFWENQLLFMALMYVIIALWTISVVSIFK